MKKTGWMVCWLGLVCPAFAATLNVDSGTLLQSEDPLNSAPITGSETITKTGSGTYIIDLTNTTSGTTTLSEGTLQIGNGTTSPAIGSPIINMASGTMLSFNYGTQKNLPNVTVNITGTATLRQANSSGSNNYLGCNGLKIAGNNSTLFLDGASGTSNNYAFYNPDLTGLTNSEIVLSTTLGISGQRNLGATGSGNVLILDGSRLSSSGTDTVGTFDNDILIRHDVRTTSTIAAGWGELNQFTFTGNISDYDSSTSGYLYLTSGVINLNGTVNSNVVLGLTLAGDSRTTLGSSTSQPMRWGGLTGNGTFVVTSTDAKPVTLDTQANATYNGVISGPVNLTKTGNATQTFSNVQKYTGTTTVSGGVLQLTAEDAIATSAAVEVNATLDMASTTSQTLVNLSGTGSVTHSGTNAATLTVMNDADTTFSGNITNDLGTVALTKTGGENAHAFGGKHLYRCHYDRRRNVENYGKR